MLDKMTDQGSRWIVQTAHLHHLLVTTKQVSEKDLQKEKYNTQIRMRI